MYGFRSVRRHILCGCGLGTLTKGAGVIETTAHLMEMERTMLIPCPKCKAASTDLYQDNSTSQWRGYPHNAVLHCYTCGHRLYGQVALTYAEPIWLRIQKEEAEAKMLAHHRLRQEAKAKAEAKAEAEVKSSVEDLDMENRLEQRRKRDREYQKRKYWLLKAKKEATRKALECAWHECSGAHKENSKYCSRGCSNKNARLRAKQRKAVA